MFRGIFESLDGDFVLGAQFCELLRFCERDSSLCKDQVPKVIDLVENFSNLWLIRAVFYPILVG